MRNRLFLSLLASAGLLVGSAAEAGVLTAATWESQLQGIDLTVTNSSAMCVDTLDTHVQQSVTINGSNCLGTSVPVGLAGTGSATGTSFNVSITMPLWSIKQFTTGGVINLYTLATLSGGAMITGNNSAAPATMGVPGNVTVKAAGHVAKGVNASLLSPMTVNNVNTLVLVPLSVGKAGTFTGFFYVLGSTHYITVDFYAWTPHTKNFTGLTTKGAPLPNVTAAGTFMLAGGAGGVSLVSPSKISIDGMLAQRRTASFTTLRLGFAPEPGTLLLLGAGIAGLVLVGSRRRS